LRSDGAHRLGGLCDPESQGAATICTPNGNGPQPVTGAAIVGNPAKESGCV
jgi:hypothetical protein